MRYIVDHDIHLHSHLSACSNDPEQNAERILRYGVKNHLKHLCITDHFWDKAVPGGDFYSTEAPTRFRWGDLEWVSRNLPLPQAEGTRFHFGVEADMDENHVIGITRETAEKLDFIVVPNSHMHIIGLPLGQNLKDELELRKKVFLHRWNVILESGLPYHKMGLAHITCDLAASNRERSVLLWDSITDDEYKSYFSRTEKLGMGVEINEDPENYTDAQFERILRVLKLAIECGCHFYFGSDAHHPARFENCIARFNRWVDLLQLEEEQKFCPFKD